MKTKLAFLLILAVSALQACSAAPTPTSPPTPLPTFTLQPPTDAPSSTFTVTPTLEPTVAPTLTPTVTVAPTATLPDIIPYALPILPNQSATGTTSGTSDLWYFIGQKDQIVKIVLDGPGGNFTFSLRDEKNKGLLGCVAPSGSNCSIEGYALPYTGVYYVQTDSLLRQNSSNLTKCRKTPPDISCYVIGGYTLFLTFE